MKRKKHLISLLALCLSLLCTLPLISCGSAAVLTFEKYSYNVHYYTYWLSRFKASFLYSYTDVKDSDEYFDSVISSDGRTADQIMTEMSDEVVSRYLVSEYYFDQYGLTLSDSKLEEIDRQLESVVTELADGSKTAFNKIAAEYGINYRMLREIYIIEAKNELFQSYYKENYLMPALTDETRRAYCLENYAKTEVLFIGTEYKRNLDADGNPIYDENGSSSVPLSDAEKAEKDAIVASLEETLTAENYMDLRKQYNDDPAAGTYTNGYYFSLNMDYDQGVLTAARLMKPGEVRRVDTSYGVYFLLRLETEADAYSEEVNADFFDGFDDSIVSEQLDKLYEKETANVVFHDEAREGISVKTVRPCYYF